MLLYYLMADPQLDKKSTEQRKAGSNCPSEPLVYNSRVQCPFAQPIQPCPNMSCLHNPELQLLPLLAEPRAKYKERRMRCLACICWYTHITRREDNLEGSMRSLTKGSTGKGSGREEVIRPVARELVNHLIHTVGWEIVQVGVGLNVNFVVDNVSFPW